MMLQTLRAGLKQLLNSAVKCVSFSQQHLFLRFHLHDVLLKLQRVCIQCLVGCISKGSAGRAMG
jgi:hypothetical protein